MSLDTQLPAPGGSPSVLSDDDIREAVLGAMRAANLGRSPAEQLVVAADAPFFGPASALDSLGLVALLLDIEEALEQRGCAVVLSDERAVSQKRSPFRTVESLVAYIGAVARG